ncbi:hypothetical protein QLX08_003085 [Tetragonisca angustula]|uniref:Androglobin n=1 Tax=Tetragonisca angustula TaxID=166442 RepID=A0AAW1A8B3_9HYME
MSVMSKKPSETVFEASFTDDSTLWPEWSDAALNKENWAYPKNGPDGSFHDTQLVQLPSSLIPYEWIRAKNLDNRNGQLTMFTDDPKSLDLIINNKHLLHSQFTRWFISALINLQYCGRNGLEISGESGNFIWNGRHHSWRGWMNVYSMNKAGKGVQHRPVINLNGKYVVRLYFLGAWRRILVDDMIPVNEEKTPLLPRTGNDFELWPMLLAKALLKLCSLTWTDYYEIVDFHPVACLTGWVCLRLEVGYLSPQDKWDFLRQYADHFEWEVTEVTEQKSQETVKTKKTRDTDETKRTKETKKSTKTDRSTKLKKIKALIKPQPVTLFLGLEDMNQVSPDIVPEMAPCWDHFVYIVQSRDIPLDLKDVKPPLARWKLYRWLKWAINEGTIDPIEYFVPIRSLKVVSPLRKCEESVINKYSATTMEEDLRDGGTDETSQKDKSRETSKEQKKTSTESSEDISFWADFNKMEPYVKDVHFFYKLDYFRYSAKLSDRFPRPRQPNDEKSETNKRDSKKGSRKSSPSKAAAESSEFIDAYSWPRKMSKTRNEPLYVFVDSLEEKFFLIEFSTFQVSVEMFGNDDDHAAAPTIELKGNKDCLNVEEHCWFRRPERPDCLVCVSTAGTKSTVMELDRGRHLLRVYCHSESDCFVSISSDTVFHVGDRRRMYQLMCTESDTVDQMVRRISISVSRAYQAFGTESYSMALKIYYSSYLPPIEDRKKGCKLFYDQIHGYFVDEQVQLIRKIMPEDEVLTVLRALRIFFLNHTVGLDRFSAISRLSKNSRELNVRGSFTVDEKYAVRHNAASVIQAFFKMITVRKYLRIHNPRHEQHEQVSRDLMKVAELYNYNKGESLANQVLRNILKYHDKLYDVYHCSRDFEHVLQAQELKGTLTNITANQWLPVVRLAVNPSFSETVLASIDLFVNLPKYSVRVFKNETGQEVLRSVNNVVPTRYEHAKLGYTLFCYGWSEDQTLKELPWSLNIITVKGQPVFHFLMDEATFLTINVPPVLAIKELSNSYIPNAGNYVSKWIVRVAKPSVVSFRLRVSYEKVRMSLRVTDEEGRLLSQAKDTCVVILPMVYLDLRRRSTEITPQRNEIDDGNSSEDKINSNEDRSKDDLRYTIYHVEALILENSWPLTRTEWSLVSEFKVIPTGSVERNKTKMLPSSNVARLSKNESFRSKKVSRSLVQSVPALESPYWVLQVVTDSGSGLEIFQDRTKEMEIARMKEAWAKENPDSLQRGRELREAFIKKHEIKSKSSIDSPEKKVPSHPEKSLRRDGQRLSAGTSEISMAHLEERTLKTPASLRKLPPLDLTVYEVREEEEEDKPRLKTESDEEILRNIRTMNIVYAQDDYAHFLEELENLYRRQKYQYKTLYGRYLDEFLDRRSILEDVYEARRAYIDSMRPVAASSTKSTKKSVKSKKSKT